ncbi:MULTISPECIES: GNAT family N-acetyltransferase [Chryseobacterium]|jgi:ribosomal protein S18 acetylase RimI-like enzyme|uniref:N-acetyltransferase domain-containing protein n=2 Tax=Chryseobacterium TaxID=59732 RepID=A0A101CHC4_9FLAO|nr:MULTISPECIES: GNAT family N-acetyltransferase [Chryseobacterium]KUJ56225.1 hypothetical protein AR686_06525 [Chryseobacterium aquaticum subsp. greenlandense]QQV01809.1 GNAT family N-acetyltransferase [Chryseobacterium sp. FDAARGOS 1104]VFB04979.1 Predicted acetyltransferase [Chryseobacterium taihuense]
MFKDFSDELNAGFVQAIQNLNKFQTLDFYYIIEAFDRVMSGQNNYYDAWIYENDNKWCVGFWINGNYLFNSKNLDESDLIIVNERICFSNFKNDGFHFAGNTDFINSISEINTDFELAMFKERYFYSASKMNIQIKIQSKHHIDLLSKNDIEKTALLYQKYYNEEYDGHNDKSLEEVKLNINYLISENLIYKLEVENEIVGFCTKMSFLSYEPNMIGTIFIDEQFRNRKYAQLLLSEVCKELMKYNEEIYLMTTQENISSNKMVENLGFVRQYKHSDRTIKNHA